MEHVMAVIIGILLALLAVLGFGGDASQSAGGGRAPAATGSIRVIARACPADVTSANASASNCPIWPDGAAIQATDMNGNAWGMNASRDASLPGDPVIYSLDGLNFTTYTLGSPQLPAGFSSAYIAGARATTGGQSRIELTPEQPHAEITVYFLRSS